MGDDAVGSFVAKKLIERGYGDRVINAEMSPESFIKFMIEKSPDIIIFVDAVKVGLTPGNIIVDSLENAEQNKYLFTTHDIPLKVILDFIRKKLSKHIEGVIVGIEVERVHFLAPISQKVISSANMLITFFSSILSS